MTWFLRRTGALCALLLGALATVAAWRWITGGAPGDVTATRLVGALLEQVGTFLPFAAYAAGIRTARDGVRAVPPHGSWALPGAGAL